MSNVIQIKNGASQPSIDNLYPFELGYVRGGALYIKNEMENDSGEKESEIIKLADPRVAELINENNYLVLPKISQFSSDDNKDYGIIVISTEDNEESKVVQYITKSQILEDLDAFPKSGGIISGETKFDGAIILKEGISYGYTDPNFAGPDGAALDGTDGQLYFVITE